ncbi:hypothetical protein AGMMS50239_27050 [Bacteroidia bacterium]|nr:hypothetical protein AGMMS50239_27050 [Bacteroidia bacterium]
MKEGKSMKTRIFKAICRFLAILLAGVVFVGCDFFNSDSHFPSTEEEWEQAAETARYIAEESNKIIESVVSDAYLANELIDPNVILEQVKRIEGVESAKLTPNSTAIVVHLKEGIAINLLIVTADDERFFMEETNPSALRSASGSTDFNPYTSVNTRAGNEDYILPGGNGKALILAPFQHEFKLDIDAITGFLQRAGYSLDNIDCFIDENADWTKFQGDFLSDYDMVFISTHGNIDMATMDKKTTSSALLTGTKWSASRSVSLSKTVKNYKQFSCGSPPGDENNYLAVTVPWLKATTTKKFNNSWIYIDACHSSEIKTGEASFVEYFINEGAAGYNGYDNTINSLLANEISLAMFYGFTSGVSFTEASNSIKENEYLKSLQYQLRFWNAKDWQTINVNLFSNTAKYSQPFYLIFPPEVDDKGLTEDVKDIVPSEILDNMTDLGLPIYGGNTPPNIAGTYKISPVILKGTNITNDYPIGSQFADTYITFSEQNNGNLTMKVNKIHSDRVSEGTGAFIVGKNNDFSVFVELTTTNTNGSKTKTVEVYSGTIAPEGIKNCVYSLFMIDNGGAPNTIANKTGRVFWDTDKLSERVTETKASLKNAKLLPSDRNSK